MLNKPACAKRVVSENRGTGRQPLQPRRCGTADARTARVEHAAGDGLFRPASDRGPSETRQGKTAQRSRSKRRGKTPPRENREVDEAAYVKLQSTVKKFVGLYAGQKGQPQDAFFATVEQALFLSNAADLGAWLKPNGDNLTARLQKLEDSKAIADELYLSVLTRKATGEETAAVTEYLSNRKDDRTAALSELAWAPADVDRIPISPLGDHCRTIVPIVRKRRRLPCSIQRAND